MKGKYRLEVHGVNWGLS